MKIAVIGTGYVGLVTGVVLARLGNDVICVDKDPVKLEMLRAGTPPIFEPGIDEMLKSGLTEGFLTVMDSVGEATEQSEIVFIAVGTPTGEDGYPDLSAVRSVVEEIADHIRRHTVVVNKSTVPVGSGSMVEDIIRAKGVPDHLFDVVSNPEFLREGSAIRDTLEPERIIIGARNELAAKKLIELYAPLDHRPTIITDVNSAELIKYAANSFLAMKISFINAISLICERAGADVADVARGIGLDSRIGSQFLQAGLGWGGSCFPKDVQGLLKTGEQYGYDFKLLRAVVEINEEQTRRFVARMAERLGGLEGRTIALMGLAFKPNTDDIRDAKSLEIIQMVLAAGGRVRAFDPIATENVRRTFSEVEYVKSVYDVTDGADAVVVVTEWSEFRQLDLERLGTAMKSRIMFDGRRIYRRDHAERAGFEYFTIGA